MQGRKWLALDMLVVTVCCALWLSMLTGARDKSAPQDAVQIRSGGTLNSADGSGAGGGWTAAKPAKLSASAPSTATGTTAGTASGSGAGAGSGELSLYLDKKTVASQTLPDNPGAVLKSGVTVASGDAVSRPPANTRPAAPDVDPSASVQRLKSRQDSLSFGSGSAQLERSGSATAPPPVESQAQPASAQRFPIVDTPSKEANKGPAPEERVILLQDKVPAVKSAAAAKPVAKPQSKPITTAAKAPAPKLQPALVHVAAAKAAKPAVSHSAKNLTAHLPPADKTAHPLQASAKPVANPGGAKSLREHFNASDLAKGNDSVVLPPGEELVKSGAAPGQPDATESVEPGSPSVIATHGAPGGKPASPSLGEALHGTGSGALGAQVPKIGWQYGVVLLLLALGILAAGWMKLNGARNPFKLLSDKKLNIIETINLAPGRQIMLIEMRGAALVLGVTPQSINLLERMPLEILEGSYQPMVQQIITRESAARTADWAARPRFAAAGGGRPVSPSLVPPLRSSYGPPPQGRMSVSELRTARAAGHRPAGFGELRVSPRPGTSSTIANDNRSKAELIDNLRRQLDQLER